MVTTCISFHQEKNYLRSIALNFVLQSTSILPCFPATAVKKCFVIKRLSLVSNKYNFNSCDRGQGGGDSLRGRENWGGQARYIKVMDYLKYVSIFCEFI